MYSSIKKLFAITEVDGFSEAEIDKAKSVHGSIPMTLEKYYRELGNDNIVNHTQNNLTKPWEEEWQVSDTHMVIYAENQCVCYWGISLEDLEKENPPVYICFENDEWELESDTVSNFLIAMAHLNGGFGLEHSLEDIYMISEEEANVIREKYIKKCEPLKVWVSEGIEFYGNDNGVVVMIKNDEEYDMCYACNNESDFEEMNGNLYEMGSSY